MAPSFFKLLLTLRGKNTWNLKLWPTVYTWLTSRLKFKLSQSWRNNVLFYWLSWISKTRLTWSTFILFWRRLCLHKNAQKQRTWGPSPLVVGWERLDKCLFSVCRCKLEGVAAADPPGISLFGLVSFRGAHKYPTGACVGTVQFCTVQKKVWTDNE